MATVASAATFAAGCGSDGTSTPRRFGTVIAAVRGTVVVDPDLGMVVVDPVLGTVVVVDAARGTVVVVVVATPPPESPPPVTVTVKALEVTELYPVAVNRSCTAPVDPRVTMRLLKVARPEPSEVTVVVPLTDAPATASAVTCTPAVPTLTTGRALPDNATPFVAAPGWVCIVSDGVPLSVDGMNSADSDE